MKRENIKRINKMSNTYGRAKKLRLTMAKAHKEAANEVLLALGKMKSSDQDLSKTVAPSFGALL